MKKVLSMLLCLSIMAGFAAVAAEPAQVPLRVLTSFYPLHIFARNILRGVESVDLQNLSHPTTGCLHDYQLLASDMKRLAQSDMLLINGGGMEPFLDIVGEQFPDLRVADSSEGIRLMPNMELLEDDPDGQAHEEDEHGPEEDAHDHEHGGFNAHIWLDPQNAVIMSRNMAEALKAALPGQAALIERNLADYTLRLEALDEELKAQFGVLQDKDIVTFHEAFPYFAKAYGLHVVAVLALEPDEALTPRMLSTLVDKVRDAGLPPLFTEPQYEDRAARAVAQETGARIYELDPIVTGDGNPQAYEEGMRRNAQVLLEALGGN